MAFGANFMRMVLIVLNIVFTVMGLIVLGLGVWAVAGFSTLVSVVPALQAEEALVTGAGISCIVLGAFTTLVCLFGLFGAWKRNRLFLTIFAIVMTILTVSVLSAAIIADVREDWVEDLMASSLQDEMTRNETTGLLQLAVTEFDCCGIYSVKVGGCPLDYPVGNNCVKGSEKCQNGCLDAIWDAWFKPYLTAAIIILFVMTAALGILAAMAFCVCNQGKGADFGTIQYSRTN